MAQGRSQRQARSALPITNEQTTVGPASRLFANDTATSSSDAYYDQYCPVAIALPHTIPLNAAYWNQAPASTKVWKIWWELPK